MREHDYLMQNSHSYQSTVKDGNRAAKVSSDYRAKYLELRKMVRELCADHDITTKLTKEQRKAFGIK
jgi:hypothetical protein